MAKKILVTGTAGFIGFHLTEALLLKGIEVVGVDNINDYYDVELKYARLEQSGIRRQDIEWDKLVNSTKHEHYRFIRMNLEDKDGLLNLCRSEKFDVIVHLAAQAGVRYSINNPDVYAQSNLLGFLNILECARHNSISHLIYASSSSVYGLNKKIPFSVKDNVDHPVSLYAATKKANELMAHAYSHLYKIPTTGLRFFTVYGPWGRPDMAYFLFADAITHDKPIDVFNYGKLRRDFTYIDDIVEGIISVMQNDPTLSTNHSGFDEDDSTNSEGTPYNIYNIGNNKTIELIDFIKILGREIGKEVKTNLLGMQAGDVTATWANVDELQERFGYAPDTNIETGLRKFVNWYKRYNIIR